MRELLRGGLRRLAGRARSRHELGDRRATVLAISALKGGVGKTTTAVNLASALARFENKRVLLVDLDPQGHVATALSEQVQPGGGRLSTVLEREDEPEVMEIAAHTTIPRLHITPRDPSLGRSEDLLATRIGKELVLRDALRATRTWYDLIVLDCPPNLGNLTLNALVACDQVLVPCDPSALAVQGVERLVRTIATVAGRLNPELDVLGVLLTRVDGRNSRLNKDVLSDIQQAFGAALLPLRIGTSTHLARAQHDGQDIFAWDESCRAARQYRELARYVAAETT